jgi:hypothetical protein
MNPSLLGAVTAFLLGLLWWSGRARRPLLRSSDTAAVAALNRAQIADRQARVHPGWRGEVLGVSSRETASAEQAGPPAGGRGGADVPLSLLPATERERRAFLALLGEWVRGDATDRLRAMAALHRWRHREGLPLLRRGLRDPHPAVMLEAARALEAFRGKPSGAAQQPGPLTGPEAGPAVGREVGRGLDQSVRLPRNVARTR